MKTAEKTKRLIQALRQDAELHEKGSFRGLGDGLHELYQVTSDDPGAVLKETFSIVWRFWDAWLDSAAHEFRQQFYEGIAPGDWPRLARKLADALESGVAVQNEPLLEQFRRTVPESSRSRRLWWLLPILAFLVLGLRWCAGRA